jgi:hypothetical protein
VLTDDESAAAVQIRFDGAAHADVRYSTPSGEQLSRKVELPPIASVAFQVVSWLTVNLVRDEASELLEQLRARRRQEAESRAADQPPPTRLPRQGRRQAAGQSLPRQGCRDKPPPTQPENDRAGKISRNTAGGPQNQGGTRACCVTLGAASTRRWSRRCRSSATAPGASSGSSSRSLR